MNVKEWSKSSVDYGRKLVDSALDGARTGEERFLNHEPLAPFLGESARRALCPAAIGTCLGLAYGCRANQERSVMKVAAHGLLGGLIGFGVGLIWESRYLTASVASTVRASIRDTRNEHWCEKNPIDYA